MTDPFLHIVFFWLHEPANEQHRQAFEAAISTFLTNSVHAGDWHVGIPAGTDRPVVDNSWTYSLTVTFSSPEKQSLYQKEEAHLTFIAEAGHLWSKVQVYDTLSTPLPA